MSITRSEFLRLLPAAVGQRACRCEGDVIEGAEGEISWRIAIAERGERRIALLALPVLEVTLELETAEPARAADFLERFLRGFQRAGG